MKLFLITSLALLVAVPNVYAGKYETYLIRILNELREINKELKEHRECTIKSYGQLIMREVDGKLEVVNEITSQDISA